MNIKKMKTILKREKGAVPIVEAAFVFPIVIFVVILLIFLGNFFYQQSKMDSIAVRASEYLASIYTTPMLIHSEIPTDTTKINAKPYRYLLGDSTAETKAKEYINSLMASTGSGYFSGMELQGTSVKCKINNYVVYQTVSVQIDYKIELLPMKLFDLPSIQESSVATKTCACDADEFIRVVDMVMDYSSEFKLTEKLQGAVSKFKGS